MSESSGEQEDKHARAVFAHRFAPLQLKTPSTPFTNDTYSYAAYKQSATTARKTSVCALSDSIFDPLVFGLIEPLDLPAGNSAKRHLFLDGICQRGFRRRSAAIARSRRRPRHSTAKVGLESSGRICRRKAGFVAHLRSRRQYADISGKWSTHTSAMEKLDRNWALHLVHPSGYRRPGI